MLHGLDFRDLGLHNPSMARSSTTYAAKWKSGKTTVVRVPEALADRVVEFAQELDDHCAHVREAEAAYRTAADVDLGEPVNVAAVPQRSPFRYPGGKTWLVPYVRSWLRSLAPRATVLIEPFAGGGIVGLTGAFENLVDHAVLVEKDEDVASVWRAILGGQAEWLACRIERFELTRDSVAAVLKDSSKSQRERAFCTILRNRVQRGGILAAGAGLVKNGENGRGLLSRWYPDTLARRVRAIAASRHRLAFIEGDGFRVIEAYADDEDAAFYVDPPYTSAARRLYSHWQVNHRMLFALLKSVKGRLLMTYDNTDEIRSLATEFGFQTQSVAMKNTHHIRMTELLIGKDLRWLKIAQASPKSPARTAQATRLFPQ